MTPQWDSRRVDDSRNGEQALPRTEAGLGSGGQPHGRPVARVDFFRRMPTGSSTAYVQPTDALD